MFRHFNQRGRGRKSMFKRYGTVILATLVGTTMFLGVPGFADKADAGQSKQKMEEEITALKKDLGDVQDMLDELDERVGDNEKHTASDRLNWSVNLRSELNSLHYIDALVMPEFAQVMMAGWAWDQLAVPLTAYGLPADVAGTTDPATMQQVLDGKADFTFDGNFMQAYMMDLIPLLGTMLDTSQGASFLSGIYFPMQVGDGDPANGGMPAGGFADADSAAQMLGAMTPEETAAFFQAYQPVAVINNVATSAGTPLFGRNFNRDAMGMYQAMFKGIPPAKADIDNDAIWTTRIRMDMRSDPNPHLTFGARLTANKIWGDSTGVKWFNGSFDSMALDGNIHNKGSDSVMRLERGFVTYRNDFGDVHWHFSLGRRPALGGGPWEVSTHGNLGASPLAHVINWQFDGASLGFDISKVTGLEGMNFKFCYGQGYESGAGSGNSNAMSPTANINDVNFLGYIFRLYEDSNLKVSHLFARAFDVTDGFTGITAMPFAINGQDINNDGEYDNFTMDVNYGGYISRFEPTANLGSIDLISLLIQGKHFGVDWFVDMASNMAKPSGFSKSAMFQFMGMDSMLNASGELKDQEGYSVWAGLKLPIPWTNGALGFEYNWGSKYWFGFNIAEDTLGANKLATRGNAYEVYYHQPVIGTKLLISIGGQYYDYEYTGSGNFLGEPVKIEDATVLDTVMPVPAEMWTAYINMVYRW